MKGKIILQNVRCSYVFVTNPKTDESGEDKYSVQVLIHKDDPQLAKIKKLVMQSGKEKFGENVNFKSLKLPIRNGDEMEGEEYQNHFFINVNNTRKPGIVNRQNEIADHDDIQEYCYSGAYFHVSVVFFAFDTGKLKGIGAGLQNIMLRKKGDRLDGMTSATSDFSDFADDPLNDDIHSDDNYDDDLGL